MMAFLVGFGSSPPTNQNKKEKEYEKNVVEIGTPLTKLSGSKHDGAVGILRSISLILTTGTQATLLPNVSFSPKKLYSLGT